MNALEEKLGYRFKDPGLLLTALTHSSYANEHACECNERLEFLGDSILGMVTAEELYLRFPDMPEGKMTRLRAELVCEGALYSVADTLGFGKSLRLGKGEEMTGGRTRHSILADCVEAVIAAVYLDGGMNEAKALIHRAVLSRMEISAGENHDWKTELQELVQMDGNSVSYELCEESGPDHSKYFRFRVLLNGTEIGEGGGRTKKEAEQQAAKAALENGLSNERKA